MGLRFDRKVTFLTSVVEKNDAGEMEAVGWQEGRKAWASYTPVSDGERLQAAAVQQKAEARFVVRWHASLASLDGENRLHFEGADWHVTGIKEVGRRRALEISAWKIHKAGG